MKYVAWFCPYLMCLSKAMVKRLQLIALTNKVSTKNRREIFLCLSLIKNILNKHSKLRMGKYEIHASRLKEVPGSKMEPNPVL